MLFSFAKKHQKFSGAVLLAVFVFIVLGGAFLPLSQAWGEETPEKTVSLTPSKWNALFGDVVNGILYGVMFAAGMILTMESDILMWVLGSFNWENTVVEMGWGIVRDVANLFFIIVIMIIAFATVLQLESYGMKALLPKLIAIALLINFSLAICGFLINFADAFGKTFVDLGGGAGVLTKNMASGLRIESITNEADVAKMTDNDIRQKIRDGKIVTSESSFLFILLSLLMGILIALISIFVMGAAIFFMLVRQIALIMIVMLSPMALICLLLPFLNSYWNKWKEAFIKWVMFYPIYMFFFYIAIQIIAHPPKFLAGGGIKTDQLGFTASTAPIVLWKMFLASMLLVGAIKVAQEMSIVGASAIGSFGKGALKTITGAGLAQKGLKAVGARVKEEAALRRAQIGAKIAPTATMRREAELRAEGIEKKRGKDFARLVEHKTDPTTGKAVLTDKGKYLAEKYANNPTSRYHKMSVKALAGKWEPSKPKPLTADDIERLEKKLSEKIL